MVHTCGNVNGLLRSPDESEVECHTQDAAHRIDERLQLHSPENLEEPDQQLPRAVFAFLYFQSSIFYFLIVNALFLFSILHYSLGSVPHISLVRNVLKKELPGRLKTRME